MNRFDPDAPRRRSPLDRTKAYFGFAEPGLTWRQRCAIFMENERRALSRLLGSRRPEDACISSLPPAGE